MSSHDSVKTKRRDLLKTTGATLGGGMMIGLAGCSGGDSSGSDGSSGNQVREVELIMTTANYDPIRYEFGQLIAANWRELGLRVRTNPTAWNSIVDQAMVNQNFDGFTLNWSGRAERIDPDHFCYGIFHSSQTEQGQNNFVNYTNEEYDQFAEQQRRTVNEEERRQAVYRCQEIAMSEQPHTPIASRNQVMPYNSNRYQNPKPMLGEGLMSFWNHIGIEPRNGVTTLRLGYPSDVNNLNPLNSQATHDVQTLRLIYDRLFRINREGRPEPWAAEGMERVDDATFDVTLREGMTWHDGEPVTIEDVKFTYDYVDENSPTLSQGTSPIETSEVIGDRTIRFNLGEPFAPFVANTLGRIYILPQHIWQGVPGSVDAGSATDWANPSAIGSGPFRFEEWRRQEQLRLSAFEDHFSPPNIDELVKVPGSSMQTLVNQIQNDQIDMIGWVPQPNTQDQLEQANSLSLSSQVTHGFYHINYKCDEEPFNDVAFRRALAYAIPKQDIVETLLNGRGVVAQSNVTQANEVWHNPDVENFNLDLEAARQELRNAGYSWNSDDMLLKPSNSGSDNSSNATNDSNSSNTA